MQDSPRYRWPLHELVLILLLNVQFFVLAPRVQFEYRHRGADISDVTAFVFSLPHWLVVLAGVAIASSSCFLIGWPRIVVRVGLYLAYAMLAFALLAPSISPIHISSPKY
jgi:ABC-type branched-subunit amino acid transport system permease subunit